MTAVLTAWLSLTLTLTAFAYAARRPVFVASLPIAAVAALYLVALPMGTPSYAKPPAGKFKVIGARIDVPSGAYGGAIYVLLDGPVPTYYCLPYSTGAANELQAALDGSADGEGGVEGEFTSEGVPEFYEKPVAPDEPKRAETPMIGG